MGSLEVEDGEGRAGLEPGELAWRILSSAGARRLFAIYDGARDAPRLHDRLAGSGLPHACLFGGRLASPLRQAAPWCVQLDPTPPAQALVRAYWGKAAGIFVSASRDLDAATLCRQLKRLLRVALPSGTRALFRFYDPRVLRPFLPTCDEEQWRTMVGPHDSLWCESEDGSCLLRYGAQAALALPIEHRLRAADDQASRQAAGPGG